MKTKHENVNGWGAIANLLIRNGKNQSWLAEQLGVTPAAITQYKQGIIYFSGGALEKICKVTGATNAEKKELYSQIVNGRLFGGRDKVKVEIK